MTETARVQFPSLYAGTGFVLAFFAFLVVICAMTYNRDKFVIYSKHTTSKFEKYMDMSVWVNDLLDAKMNWFQKDFMCTKKNVLTKIPTDI